jgi:hypothetical protein
MGRTSNKRNRQESSPARAEKADVVVFQERPKICLIDIDVDAKEALTSAGFNCTVGSLGSPIKLPNVKRGDKCLCRPNNHIPQDLHEYDIIVMNLAITMRLSLY